MERRIGTQIFWILLANLIFIATNDFGLQYGGSNHLATKHEVLSIDLGEIPPGQTIFTFNATPKGDSTPSSKRGNLNIDTDTSVSSL